MVKGPARRWTHIHRFRADGPASSVIEDTIEYDAPLGTFVVRRDLAAMFAFRHRRTRNDLMRQAAFARGRHLRVAVIGSNGLIESELVPFLTTAGHHVVSLGSSPAGDELEGVDAVVQLDGGVSSEWFHGLRNPPSVLVSLSDIDAPDGPPATAPAGAAGTRVVTVRRGTVVSARNGATARWLMRIRLALGGRFGSGRPFANWIALDDLVGAIYQAIHDDQLSGTVKAVAPNEATSGDLEAVGYRFDFPDLEDALRFQLGR